MGDKIKPAKVPSLGTMGTGAADGAKYTQQAQARNAKRTVYRAEIAKDEKGMYTLTPEKVTSK